MSGSKRMKVLIMGYIWPELTSSAAGLRDWNLVRTFLQQNWEVLYSSQAKKNQFSEKLEKEGVRTVRQTPNDSQFDEWIGREMPDFVVFDRYVTEEQFGWRVKDHSPATVQVLDTQDLHFLRKQRHSAFEKGISLDHIAKADIDLHSDVTMRELAAIYRSDCTLLISDFEFHLLTKVFHIHPSMLHISRLNYSSPLEFEPWSKRVKDFCMIGNFRHAPNYDATCWLKNDIWPLIRQQMPTAEVDIFGAYPPKEIMQLSNPEEGFHVKGPVKDHMKMFTKYRVNLAPLRFGAGIKGKISDGWHSGTPAVSTPIGSEGMTEYFPFGGEVSMFSNDELSSCELSARDFASRAISLCSDEGKWREAQGRGRVLMNNLYCHNVNSKALVDRMLHTKKNMQRLRSTNWIGSVLSFELSRGTKYFSQWIEEKNKNNKRNY